VKLLGGELLACHRSQHMPDTVAHVTDLLRLEAVEKVIYVNTEFGIFIEEVAFNIGTGSNFNFTEYVFYSICASMENFWKRKKVKVIVKHVNAVAGDFIQLVVNNCVSWIVGTERLHGEVLIKK